MNIRIMNYAKDKKRKISAVVLVGGDFDKHLLKKCLDSLFWVDEIIKVDTKPIRGGFSEWRNEGAKRAKGDWIFYVDSDEEIPHDLCREIELIINNSELKIGSYAIPRRNFIFRKEFRYGGLYPDYQKRLFLKSAFKKWEGKLHEEPRFEGKLGHLKNAMIHHKNLTISEMLAKTNEWSEIEAQLMFEANHPPMNALRFFSAGFREFWKRMIVQMAFLDGKEGIIYAIYQVYSRLISYAKLWEKQQSTIRI